MKNLLVPMLLGAMCFSAQAQEDYIDDYADEGDLVVNVDGDITVNSSNKNRDIFTNANHSDLTISVEWQQRIRAVITSQIGDFIVENDLEIDKDFDINNFVEEAFIEIREIGGTATAVVIGKQSIAFGLNMSSMPIEDNNEMESLQEIKEVHALTVELSDDAFGYFDQLEVSIFETNAGDLSIGKLDGASVRASKMFVDKWFISVSHAKLGNRHLNTDKERRTSVGVIGQSVDGTITGWIEGIKFSKNPQYLKSNFAFSAGLQKSLTDTVEVMAEYNYIDHEDSSIGFGIKKNLTDNLSISAEARHHNYVYKRDDTFFGISITYRFGATRSYVHANADSEVYNPYEF